MLVEWTFLVGEEVAWRQRGENHLAIHKGHEFERKGEIYCVLSVDRAKHRVQILPKPPADVMDDPFVQKLARGLKVREVH